MLTLLELAERFKLPYRGDGGTVVTGIGTLANAQAGQLAFLANSKYGQQLGATKAGIVVLGQDDADSCPVACLICKDPYTTFAQISVLFDIDETLPEGIPPSAALHARPRVSPTARTGTSHSRSCSAWVSVVPTPPARPPLTITLSTAAFVRISTPSARAEDAIAADTPPVPFLAKPHARNAPSISPM